MVAVVKSQGAPWKADVPTRFDSYNDAKQLCGTVMRTNEMFKERDYAKTKDQQWNGVVADSFDVRTTWLPCASVSGHFRDQSSCGSCWAFGSTEAFDDRRCIATGRTFSCFSGPADRTMQVDGEPLDEKGDYMLRSMSSTSPPRTRCRHW